jgi:hypothetical protein
VTSRKSAGLPRINPQYPIFFHWLAIFVVNGLFGSLLDQFVSSFARADVLASIEFDSDWFIDFSFSVVSFEGQVCQSAEF